MVAKLELTASDGDAEQLRELRDRLRRKYGIYTTSLVIDPEWSLNRVAIAAQDAAMEYSDETAEGLADFITSACRLEGADLSCRDDSTLLDSYRNPDGRLDIYRHPGEWIEGNPVIQELIQKDPSIRNMLDFVYENQGLFIKPPLYKAQGNYWNSTSNGGLPIVRKKDVTHEATFMLHDLHHMSIQDPLPYDASHGAHNPASRMNFVFHRMASEATTMVLADMSAVHTLELEQAGYDTTKRRIYPLYKDILAHNPRVSIQEVIRANIEFCFTGDSTQLRALGASEDEISRFSEKYETFFSADFDWNDHNYLKCNDTVVASPDVVRYYQEANAVFGLPTIDDIYSGDTFMADQVAENVLAQVEKARSYVAHHDEVRRMKQVARRFYGGQLYAFYHPSLQSTDAQHRAYINTFKTLLAAESCEEITSVSQQLDAMIEDVVGNARSISAIDSQEAALLSMHVPLYPAYFINYEQEKDKIVGLKEMTQRMQLDAQATVA